MLWPGVKPDEGFPRAMWAEEAGYQDLWFADGEGMQDALTLCAAVASRTKRIRLATGIVPVYNRPPATIAASALVIEQLAAGRFVLGLGSSTHAMIENWYGLDFEKPLQRIRETVELLRELFRGKKSDYHGETLHSVGFQLKETPTAPLPIYLAAMGPKMIELAGEIADGVILNDWTPTDRIPYALEHLDAGAKRSGRRVEDLEVVIRRAVIVTKRYQETLEFFRSQVTFYASTPVYQSQLRALGYPGATDRIKAGYATRDRRQILSAVNDEMVERLLTWGDAAKCRARLRATYDAGIDTVFVSPQGGDSVDFDASCEAFLPRNFDIY